MSTTIVYILSEIFYLKLYISLNIVVYLTINERKNKEY